MDTTFLTIIAVLFAGIIILMLRNDSLRQICVNGLYIISGVMAWYVLETADRSQPIYLTMLLVFLLCVIPMLVDALILTAKRAAHNRQHREKFFASYHHFHDSRH